MDKLLEMLGVEKLDESAQTKIKEKLQTIIEVKAKELSQDKLKEEKENLIETYEKKFEEYKEEITSKFSNFLDSVLDEEMVIPEKIQKYAKQGELYEDLINQFKIRLSVDQGLLDEEVKGLLKEAKDEIIKLREDIDKKIARELELMEDAQELAAELYIKEKCEGLTESQKEKVYSILEGIKNKEEIDKKFDIIVESSDINKEDGKDKKDEEEEEEDGEENEGKGQIEVEDKDKINEDDDPFKEYVRNTYLKVLKENKI